MLEEHETWDVGSIRQIDSGYFCAGVVVDDLGRVIRAAPIVKYMRGWTLKQVEDYCREKRWTLRL